MFNFTHLIIIAVNYVDVLLHQTVVDDVANISEVHAVSIFDLGSSMYLFRVEEHENINFSRNTKT
jgi:hypothetical protein